MKKLMIAIASAAALVGVAKASSGLDYFTTFESLTVGNPFDADTSDVRDQQSLWSVATNSLDYATVTNADFNGSAPTNTSTKALYIDSSGNRLSRNVNGGADPESFATDAVFFDGYVQFTASDTVPTPESGDKLVVWLYGGDADTPVEQYQLLGLTEETKATTNLVITAGLLDGEGYPTPTNFLVSAAAIEPNSWHRLTIKAFTEGIMPKFAVWVDETRLSAGGVNKFSSLVKFDSGAAKSIAAISFEGTGAVDDLGFTKIAPDFTQEVVAETFNFTLSYDDDALDDLVVYGVKAGEENVDISGNVENGVQLAIDVGLYDNIRVVFTPAEGYTVTCPAGYTMDGDAYVFVVQACAAGESAVLAIVTEGGDEPSDYPSYIDDIDDPITKAAYASKYAAWTATNGADTGSKYRDQFLLNIATNVTAELKSATVVIENGVVKITTNPAADSVNGTVYIKKGTTLAEMEAATWTAATVPTEGADAGKVSVTPGSSDTAGFYKIKVDF